MRHVYYNAAGGIYLDTRSPDPHPPSLLCIERGSRVVIDGPIAEEAARFTEEANRRGRVWLPAGYTATFVRPNAR